MLMLAGGGESCSDIEHLGSQPRLFGEVCSDSTLYRTFTETLGPEAVARGREAMAGVRSQVWSRLGLGGGDDPVILDVDSTFVDIHSENKEGTAAHYKGGVGFHPMFCFADATGEVLAARLRPGNAGVNTVLDLLGVVDDAVSQLPDQVRAGHLEGDDAAQVAREILVRSDSAADVTFALAPGLMHRRRLGKAIDGAELEQLRAGLEVARP